MTTRKEIVNQAIKWIGLNEYDGSHMEIINTYNSHKPLARGYSVKKNDSWCATFVSAVSIKCNATDIMPTECSCYYMIELYKKIGRWRESDNYVPSAGDIIMYDWDDNGVGENTGAPEHVGIVVDVVGDTITVIEGNKNNSVEYRKMKVNGKFIRGYCLPDYASKATETDDKSTNHVISQSQTTSAPPPSSTVSNNKNKIDTIKEVQNWANKNYKAGLTADGIYGKKTKKALIKILQTELNKTYGYKLVVDGVWGSKTENACKTLKSGVRNNIVSVLQALLICNKISNVYVDGSYGSLTVSAVKTYQKKVNLVVDGVAGKNTFAKLCG